MKKIYKWLIPTALFTGYFVWTAILSLKNSIWHDESYGFLLTQYNYSEIIHRTSTDVHPPLYYFAIKLWQSAFGQSIFTIRLFSTITMALAILLFWRIICKELSLKSKQANLVLAAALFGVYSVRYGMEARMYGMGALITAISLWVFLKINRSKYAWWKWSLLGAWLAVGFYTQYFMILLAATYGFVIFIQSYIQNQQWKTKFTEAFKKLVPLGIGFILLAGIWLPTALSQRNSVQNSFWIGPVRTSTFVDYPTSYLIYDNGSNYQGYGAMFAGVVILIAVYGIYNFYLKQKSKDRTTLILTSLVAIPAGLLVLLSLPPFQPAFYNRYLCFYAPIFYSTILLGLLLIQRKQLRIGALGILFVIYCFGNVQLFRQGNGATFWPQPYFTMGKLYPEIQKTDSSIPTISDELWNYFDTYYYAKADGRKTYVIKPDNGFGKYGNASVVYENESLQIGSLDDVKTDRVWLIEGDKNHGLSDKIPSSWTLEKIEQKGYAKIMLYKTR